MLTSVLIAALTIASPATDTIIPVDRDTRLEVSNFRGEVVVDTWDRDAVQVEADLDDGQVLDASKAGTSLRIRPRNRNGGPREADFQITIPRWMDVRVEGNQVDVELHGVGGEVSVETVGGDVQVEGGRDQISLRSIQGEIELQGARGRVEAVSVNEEITLSDIDGEIYVETTNGDVNLENIRSSWVRATTVNGDMVYDGTIRDDGRYAFSTHNGDLEVTVAEGANVTVSVSTFHGEFESEFPVRLTGTTQDRRFNFTLGSGRAQLELESFNGEIVLRRPR
jgi:DUF4097 and DUF4098 domain-containing protein YvlB